MSFYKPGQFLAHLVQADTRERLSLPYRRDSDSNDWKLVTGRIHARIRELGARFDLSGFNSRNLFHYLSDFSSLFGEPDIFLRILLPVLRSDAIFVQVIRAARVARMMLCKPQEVARNGKGYRCSA